MSDLIINGLSRDVFMGKLTHGLLGEEGTDVSIKEDSVTTSDGKTREELEVLRRTRDSGKFGDRDIKDIRGLLLPKETSILGMVKNFFNIPKQLTTASIKKQLKELQRELTKASAEMDMWTEDVKHRQSEIGKPVKETDTETQKQQQTELGQSRATLNRVIQEWESINRNINLLTEQLHGTTLEDSKITGNLKGTQKEITEKIQPFVFAKGVSPLNNSLDSLARSKFYAVLPKEIYDFVKGGASSETVINGLKSVYNKSSSTLERLEIMGKANLAYKAFHEMGKEEDAKDLITQMGHLYPKDFRQEIIAKLPEAENKHLDILITLDPELRLATEMAERIYEQASRDPSDRVLMDKSISQLNHLSEEIQDQKLSETLKMWADRLTKMRR